MSSDLFPQDHVIYSDSLSYPCLNSEFDVLYFIKTTDSKSKLIRQDLKTGLQTPLTTQPEPSVSIGYGGRSYVLGKKFLIYSASDRKLYRMNLESFATLAISPQFDGIGAPVLSPCERFVLFLGESDGVCNIFLVDVDGREYPRKISKDPWYAFNPAFSDTHLAWQEWDRGSMPWEESRICLLGLKSAARNCKDIAQIQWENPVVLGSKNRVLSNPVFSPDAKHMAYFSDESGFRSLVIRSLRDATCKTVSMASCEMGAPDWLAGLYQIQWSLDAKSLFLIANNKGRESLQRVSFPECKLSEVPCSYTQIETFYVGSSSLAVLGSSPLQPQALSTMCFDGTDTIVRASSASLPYLEAKLSNAELLTWKTSYGGQLSGIFYKALNTTAPTAPLIVHIHGGPTAQARLGWQAEAQYFASRGYHYIYVNHRGSTGFGRAFQQSLNGNWGDYDLVDAKESALFLIDRGFVDKERIVITGGSAGGFTTLLALSEQGSFWAAGIALYAVSDLFELEKTCHRFEQNYTPLLVGSMTGHESTWRERSAINRVDRIQSPLLLIHGKKDKVVAFEQSVKLAEILKKRNSPCELLLFEDEGHGFKKEISRQQTLTAKEAFLQRYVVAKQFSLS